MSTESSLSGYDSLSTDGPQLDTVYELNVATEVPGSGGNLQKTVLQEGTGSFPLHGATVRVHYTGTLESDGSVFDSSRSRGDPFEFKLGRGQVIKGWDKGVTTMRKGERSILKCAPEYGYGSNGTGSIPANATLNFDVELLDWTLMEDISDAGDKTLLKSFIKQGDGYEKPSFEAAVVVNVSTLRAPPSGEDEGDLLFSKVDWAFNFGEIDLPPGLKEALENMKCGEEALIDVAASRVTRDDPEWKIVKGQAVRYKVELKELNITKPYQIDQDEKVKEADLRRVQGNKYFAAHDWDRAIAKYDIGMKILANPEEASEIALKVALLNNTAQAFLFLGNAQKALLNAESCLELDADNLKAILRQAKAHARLGDLQEAKHVLQSLLSKDPDNMDAHRELENVVEMERLEQKRDRVRYANMFDRMRAMKEEGKMTSQQSPQENKETEINEEHKSAE